LKISNKNDRYTHKKKEEEKKRITIYYSSKEKTEFLLYIQYGKDYGNSKIKKKGEHLHY